MSTSQFVFDAIGTKWVIDIFDKLSEKRELSLLSNIKTRISQFDKDYSRFREDSLVTTISKEAGTYLLPTDAKPLFDMYLKLYELTGGLFTPLVGNLMEDAGYDSKYSLIPKKLTLPKSWDETIVYEYPKLTTSHPVLLDIGAAGKGYLIDIVGSIIRKYSESYCIDAGGDILIKSYPDKGIRIGLENPVDTTQVIGTITLNNKSICASAGNRRKWANFHHIINPKTLTSPKDILATWVVAKNTLIADAIATCLFLTENEKLKTDFNYEYLILKNDFSIEKSLGFNAELFS